MTDDAGEQIHRGRKRPETGHALAIARWEANRENWLEGEYFGLASKKRDLQDMIGNGGTLWIVVSRGQRNGPRMYSLTFRVEGCEPRRANDARGFGQFAVIGDPHRSTLFASNDARLLLLGLRFDPFMPIDHRSDRLKVIGQSIQTPRALSHADIKLLEDFATESDRWSVFVSYQRTEPDTKVALRLSAALQARGISVFRDQEALRHGEKWWPAIRHAIARSRCLILIVGKTTHRSKWVTPEVRHALENGVRVIPVVVDGSLDHWRGLAVDDWHAVVPKSGGWDDLIDQVVMAVSRFLRRDRP
ncbi:toll/interleukin-1 receptor domain-containing protein [Variovorax sp. J22P240]|uniref:toll/interleukin-1 receptor domain-containing protein n=1 Tax=Variovorax sp. J22P240 TaxID=3053514 RepID=UPI002578B1E1|nr:toll/interleukin-1 receptor domain-containing protein [Variovorax sp. J22P240]MDM0001790.1 toll/interleukin-1 receptor domain-containing protein [Variovorax sp. J22P240]